MNDESNSELQAQLEDLKLMASGIGVTMTPMPVHMIRCATKLKELMTLHPELVSEVVLFAMENCGDQYYARQTMSRALSLINGELISPEDKQCIKEWVENEKEEPILSDLKDFT